QRAGRHAEDQRLARLLARGRRRLQCGAIIWFEIKPLAGDQDVVAAGPSAYPPYGDILADGPDQMLGRGVANLELPLLDGEQNRGAVPEVLRIKGKIIFLVGSG